MYLQHGDLVLLFSHNNQTHNQVQVQWEHVPSDGLENLEHHGMWILAMICFRCILPIWLVRFKIDNARRFVITNILSAWILRTIRYLQDSISAWKKNTHSLQQYCDEFISLFTVCVCVIMRLLLLLLALAALNSVDGLSLPLSDAKTDLFKVVSKTKVRTGSMTDRQMYDQLVRFFSMNMNTPPGSLAASLVHAVEMSPIWQQLNEQFGGSKKSNVVQTGLPPLRIASLKYAKEMAEKVHGMGHKAVQKKYEPRKLVKKKNNNNIKA